MKIQGFEASAPFYDKRRFPVGFRRCGEFTISQADILENYGRTLLALEQGSKAPVTKEEKSFVAVCKGTRAAQSLVECAWAKYKALVNKKHTVNAFGSNFKPEIEDSDEDLENDDLGEIDEADEEDDEE